MTPEDPNEIDRRAALFLWVLILSAILAVLTAIIGPRLAVADEAIPAVSIDWTASRAEYEERINGFLAEFFAKCTPRKLARARALVPVLLDVAEDERVNPSLVAAMITLESTWDPSARGKLGELGLLQVNRPGVSPDPAEQLREGIGVLRAAYERCGTLAGAVSLYATGKSCAVYRGAILRLRLAARIDGGNGDGGAI